MELVEQKEPNQIQPRFLSLLLLIEARNLCDNFGKKARQRKKGIFLGSLVCPC